MILKYGSEIHVMDLNPGTFVFMICEDGQEHKGEMGLRKAGLEVRDSIRWFHGSPVKHLTVVVGRKPVEGTVAENTLRYGCGGINVDGCRVLMPDNPGSRKHKGAIYEGVNEGYKRPGKSSYTHKTDWEPQSGGRWPANIIHDGGCIEHFPDAGSNSMVPGTRNHAESMVFKGRIKSGGPTHDNTRGSAARFFYVAETETALIEYLERLVKA